VIVRARIKLNLRIKTPGSVETSLTCRTGSRKYAQKGTKRHQQAGQDALGSDDHDSDFNSLP
jgi:hypothetical protein